jgi:hypothetical protein
MNRQDLRLPTTFLLDAEGRVVKIYRDRVDVAEILQDVPKIEASPAERLSRAEPFAGTFISSPGVRNYLPYGRELLDQGLEAPALVAFERAAQGSPSASTLYHLGTLFVKRSGRQARAAFERAGAASRGEQRPRHPARTRRSAGRDREVPGGPRDDTRLRTPSTTRYALDGPAGGGASSTRRLDAPARFPEALNNLGLILGQEAR